jgi:IS605 OrfB family transposase
VLVALGTQLGSLAGADLAQRCRGGRLEAEARNASRRERKRSLTAASSSRWAGAITRTSEDAWQLGHRNLVAEQRSLRARIARIQTRLKVPIGGRRGRARGYPTRAERHKSQQRRQTLAHRLQKVEARLDAGRVSVCRGGKPLARAHHHLDQAGLTEAEWQKRWQAERLFICADGEKDKRWGNETIRFHPVEGWVEIKLPAPLVHLANRPHGRYRLSCSVAFTYRADEVAAQADTAAIRYDLSFDPKRSRWYLDASWTCPSLEVPTLEDLGTHRVLAVDLNAGHLAAVVVDTSGNPVGAPVTIPVDLAGLPTTTRDGHLRAAISELVGIARVNQCRAIVIEDLDFAASRESGREHTGRRPSRGRRGKSFRRLVSGIPTARFRERLVQMAANAGLSVIAVDPAYTSRWGAEHWLAPLQQQFSPTVTGHHAAAVVIGRRGLGQRARRRERCDSTGPEDPGERATNSAVRATPTTVGLSGQRNRKGKTREARWQPHPRQKTGAADRTSLVGPGQRRPFALPRQPQSADADRR